MLARDVDVVMQTRVAPRIAGGDVGSPGDRGIDRDADREVQSEHGGVEREAEEHSYRRHLITEAHIAEHEVGAAKHIRREGRNGQGGETRHHEGANLEG